MDILQNKWFVMGCILVILCYIILSNCNYENFISNDISDPDILTLGKNLCSLSSKDNFLINRNTMTTDTFIKMKNDIKQIIIDMITEYANKCNDMNGNDKLGADNYTLTLACNNDPWDMEQNIVNNISEYIRKYVLKRFNIKIDRLIIIHDLMKHLDLLESVIYPLQNSNLYTIHGIQYITVNSIKNIVTNNLNLDDILYTVLTRGNISVINKSDENI